jgi:tRNA A-37 threonylcarbamoyl transferase component Bud32
VGGRPTDSCDPAILAVDGVRSHDASPDAVMNAVAASSPKIAVTSVVTGDVIAGKYRVERVLGRGAMGVVVAARHQQLDQVVAIKILARDAAEDGVAVERFLREARATARLRSEHVARVLDVGQLPDGVPYIVMEHLEGSDLGELLEMTGALPPWKACEYVVQACDAVAEAHARGIVHRDLKPENLYLTTRVGGDAMVKVLDFGISKVMSGKQGALTQTRAVVGSPLYMSPEQLRSSKEASPRSDVWALGVVLYELMTRRWPFEAESLPDLCIKVAREQARPVTEHRADLPPGLADVIARCLAKDPADRYPDAASLAQALGPFLRPEARDVVRGIRAVAGSLTETLSASPGLAPVRRGTRTRAAALVLAVVLGGGLAAEFRRGAAQPFSLAAVEAALTSSDLARVAEPTAGPAADPAPFPLPANSISPPPAAKPPPAVRPPRSVAVQPARARSVALPTAVDDIPAFR